MKTRILIKTIAKFGGNSILAIKLLRFHRKKKIIYVITPPPKLRNIGDHAQVLGIKKWFNDHFPEYLILEFDKDQTTRYINTIKLITSKDDLIFLHSGGNLGDRGLWSERARRSVIQKFPENTIISLPQTIYFSDTDKGKDELNISKKIYNSHKDLTIIARDEHSFKFAQEYFPSCKTFCCPDFVLYLNKFQRQKREKVLVCLRNDTESILDRNDRGNIITYIENLGEKYELYDTTIEHDILPEAREKEFDKAIKLFSSRKIVITDRFHGIIFSVISKTPCIALNTIDHKITDSVKWFKDLNYIFFTDNYMDIPHIFDEITKIDDFNSIDWRERYFNNLKYKLQN